METTWLVMCPDWKSHGNKPQGWTLSKNALAKKDIFVRGIEENVFLKFKSKSVEMKKTLGEAFNEAMDKNTEKTAIEKRRLGHAFLS